MCVLMFCTFSGVIYVGVRYRDGYCDGSMFVTDVKYQ
jgi:hypothetical protein